MRSRCENAFTTTTTRGSCNCDFLLCVADVLLPSPCALKREKKNILLHDNFTLLCVHTIYGKENVSASSLCNCTKSIQVQPFFTLLVEQTIKVHTTADLEKRLLSRSFPPVSYNIHVCAIYKAYNNNSCPKENSAYRSDLLV